MAPKLSVARRHGLVRASARWHRRRRAMLNALCVTAERLGVQILYDAEAIAASPRWAIPGNATWSPCLFRVDLGGDALSPCLGLQAPYG